MPFSSQKVLNVLENHVSCSSILGKGRIPPSLIERISLKIKSSSNDKIVPSPLQSGQAPCGVLKEKILGSISEMERLQTGQANFSEKSRSSMSLGFWGISNDLSLIRPIINSPFPN